MNNQTKQGYFGDYIKTTYEPFIQIATKSSITSKIALTIIKLIEIITILFVILGCVLPRNLLLWHAITCLAIIYFIDMNYIITKEYTYSVLSNNNTDYTKEELKKASEVIPLHIITCKKILFIIMAISIVGYIFPNYSLNSLIKYTSSKTDNLGKLDANINDQVLITEFRGNNTGVNKAVNEIHNLTMEASEVGHLSSVKQGGNNISDIIDHIKEQNNDIFKIDFEPIKFNLKKTA